MAKTQAPSPTDAPFVAAYLTTRGLKDSGENRGIVARVLKAYPGPRPVDTEALNAFIDRHLLR